MQTLSRGGVPVAMGLLVAVHRITAAILQSGPKLFHPDVDPVIGVVQVAPALHDVNLTAGRPLPVPK